MELQFASIIHKVEFQAGIVTNRKALQVWLENRLVYAPFLGSYIYMYCKNRTLSDLTALLKRYLSWTLYFR